VNIDDTNDDDFEFEKDIFSEAFNLNLEIRTQWGAKLIPAADKWYLEDYNFDFTTFCEFASDDFIRRAKITSACRSQRCSHETIENDLVRLRDLLRNASAVAQSKIMFVTAKHLINWRTSLNEVGREYQLGALRGYLIESRLLLGDGLIDESAEIYLEEAEFKGNTKGNRVNDLEQGRMSIHERAIFENNARVAFQNKKITKQQFLMLILFNSFGLRIVDYISLKVKDAHFDWMQGELIGATLDIPYSKTGSAPRSVMAKGNKIDPDVALLLYAVVKDRDPEESLVKIKSSFARKQTGILDGHITRSTAQIYLYRTVKRLNLGFNLNSYRFRYTVGTETYRETGNPYVAAYVLRHSDIQNVRVYTNEIVLAQAHDRVVNNVFKDFASLVETAAKVNSFQGVVISKQNFEQAKLIAIRAKEQIGKFDPIGGCSGKLSCYQGAPVACYCCPKFSPIQEADHMGMLRSTIDVFFATTEKDPKQAASLVPAIFGMAQVCYLTQNKIATSEL
jgi:integrase